MINTIEQHQQISENERAGNKGVFAQLAGYYDLLYRDKDYPAETAYIVGLIRRFCPEAKSILELGSGTGKHAHLLANTGFHVHGIERSPEMLARSLEMADADKQHSDVPPTFFSQGDIRTARLHQHFDCVIALFHVISYQCTNEDVLAALETAWDHLNVGGVFIFDVWYGPAVLTEKPEVRIKRVADEQIEVTRIAEPIIHTNANLVDVNYHAFVRTWQTGEIEDFRETHVMRYFFNTEVELMAAQTRFKVLHAEEWLTGKQIGSHTWGACFILRKVI